jgi:hypothetical protein
MRWTPSRFDHGAALPRQAGEGRHRRLFSGSSKTWTVCPSFTMLLKSWRRKVDIISFKLWNTGHSLMPPLFRQSCLKFANSATK